MDSSERQARAKVILLIEDDDETRHQVGSHLLEEGYRVLEATNGREALAHLAQITPHLIILDLKMSQMDGIAFLREQEQAGFCLDCPILILTGFADRAEEARQALATRRVHDVVIKPIRYYERFFETVYRLILEKEEHT